MKRKTDKSAKITKGKRSRPRVSNRSDKEQARLRMEKSRAQKRKGNCVPIHVWVPKSQRDSLITQGYDLSEAATKAFALLIKKRKPAEPKEEAHEPMDFTIDLNDPVP